MKKNEERNEMKKRKMKARKMPEMGKKKIYKKKKVKKNHPCSEIAKQQIHLSAMFIFGGKGSISGG